jgi:hypothetical protein
MKRTFRFGAVVVLGLVLALLVVGLSWAVGAVAAGPRAQFSAGEAYLSLSGSALRPGASNVGWQYHSAGGCVYASDGDEYTVWNAAVHLPQGAVVNRMRMYAYDSSSSSDSQAWFTVFDTWGNVEDEWEVGTSGSAGQRAWSTEIFDHQVDNTRYTYLVKWQPSALGSAMRLCGFLFSYFPPSEGAGIGGAPEIDEDDTEGASADLPPELGIGEGGGPLPGCRSQPIPPPSQLPAIRLLDDSYLWSMLGIRRLCLYGFPIGEQIDMALSPQRSGYAAFRLQEASSGQSTIPLPGIVVTRIPGRVAIAPTAVLPSEGIAPSEGNAPSDSGSDRLLDVVQLAPGGQDGTGSFFLQAQVVDGVSVFTVPVWWPVSLPGGPWLVKASAPGVQTQAFIDFAPKSGISTRPDAEIDPFVSRHCAGYAPGERMIVEGAGLDPDVDLVLGIYREEAYTLVAEDAWETHTDSEGRFSLAWSVPQGYPSGSYVIIQDPQPGYGSIFVDVQPCFGVTGR